MARPSVPTFDPAESAELWILFTGATTTTPLGQVRSFRWTQDVTEAETQRVSDSATYYDDTATKVTWDLELYEDADLVEVEIFRANAVAAGATMTLIAQKYNAEATSATLTATYTFAAAKTTHAEGGPEAGATNMWSFSGRATSVTKL